MENEHDKYNKEIFTSILFINVIINKRVEREREKIYFLIEIKMIFFVFKK